MDILGFIEFLVDPQLMGPAADVGQGGMGGLLHHIPQVSGKLNLPGTRHHTDLHFQDLAPHTGPGQTVDHAHLLGSGQPVRVIAGNPQIGFQIFYCNMYRLYTI